MSDQPAPRKLTRRSFIGGAAGATVAVGTAGYLLADGIADTRGASVAGPATTTATTPPPTTAPPAPTTTTTLPPVATSDMATRRLVVLELSGGIDTLSTLVPAANGAYYDLRPTLAQPAEELLWWDDEVALHPNLSRMNARGLAAIQGIGSVDPRGSHFGMIARWWSGQVASDDPSLTGFFGRLCDRLGDPSAPFVGVCVGTGKHAAMLSEQVNTLGLPSIDGAPYIAGAGPGDPFRQAFQVGFATMAGGPSDGIFGEARRTLAQAIGAAERLQGLPDNPIAYPDTEVGADLRTAARLLAADPGVRIVYVPIQMNFDTHVNHVETHATNLARIDEALDAFLGDMDARGMGDQVLVASLSEFGRRAQENGEHGLDHGTASVAFLAGAVRPGRYGEYSSLTDLDADDNLKPTITFDRYYATLAESWFGVPSGEVLATPAAPIPDLF
jgi:uncharacterized protein (DUF1501 family)